MKTSYIKHFLAALLLMAAISVHAEQPLVTGTTFTIMTLNVDGLPAKFLFFDVNKDGPGSAGSELISKYIASKKCDIVAMQECFNYRWEIWSRLFAEYEHDEWTGGIGTEFKELDWLHLQNERFPCDGLNMAWKTEIQSTAYERVAHEQNFGKFSHDFDDIITKGFRRHELTLADGSQIVVYNTHFDASSDRDVQMKNDGPDREARIAQWEQLREHVMAHLDKRPVIVTGDFNSLYGIDPVKTLFIDAIEATGKATVGDAWVMKCNNGSYPEAGVTVPGETLDKILYVNPVDGMAVTPTSVVVDSITYVNHGQPLGDHFPVIATFGFVKRKSPTDIDTAEKDVDANHNIYDLQGIRHEAISPRQRGVYIVDGMKVVE